MSARSKMLFAKNGVAYHAKQCEEALRLAAFAEGQPTLSPGIADGLRKLAEYHSGHAFSWSASLERMKADERS